MTTRRAFLESLSLALGIGVAVKAAVAETPWQDYVRGQPLQFAGYSASGHELHRDSFGFKWERMDAWSDVFEIGRANRDRQLR